MAADCRDRGLVADISMIPCGSSRERSRCAVVASRGFPASYSIRPLMMHDEIDARILEIVQENNRITSGALGDLVGLSATACQRRLKRLREDGVIEADISVVSAKAVGRSLQMIVLVSLERERSDIIDRFKRSIRETSEVASGFYVTGDADFLLHITARDMEDYERFTRNFFDENQDIRAFKTLVVIDHVKKGLALPVDVLSDSG